ncbi:MAG: alkaline phosphatase family protein [Cytophagales bacterium]|nr:alkaline phosphatase family protein [Cytophagales bacterium]MCA6368277.1 alkaline phosphatase family protein [Cytophagales bacterium]MCA6371093.1 alkaline phosphatase family protein [Cytophagales bacterium]MCA6377436.1 alkaline phosphatase family protein [Cytophagales bacterium]MCA6382962.1 alkaline phosphatase family protein [Cytophagales bacterium]
MKKILLLIFISRSLLSYSQETKPKLVVGIVVDQMRQEYLYRFESKFGEGGFKRLAGKGFMLTNAHYNYVPTYTGPGHASVYSGTTPSVHGIIGNDWWDKGLKKQVNCVEDDRQKPVGNPEGNGDVSPWRMLSSTITDELKISSQKRSKVIGISVKDRGAVLPAGHMADGAYWYDGKSGMFITSTYYKNTLPQWVETFNGLKLADSYLNQTWNTVLPITQYTESSQDESPYERKLQGKEKPVFPYNLKELRKTNGDFDLLAATPFGDDLLTEFAKSTIAGEQMGKDSDADFLAISYSCPDLIGHAMGPNSIEIQDAYIRLDKNIEDLLKTLDKEVGENNYVVFLTADHAVAEVPQSLKDNRIPAGNFAVSSLEVNLNDFLQKYFPGKKIIEKISNDQIFLNQDLFAGDPKSAGIDLLIATELITNYLQSVEGVAQVFSKAVLKQGAYNETGIKGMMVRGYNFKRSGDIAYQLEPSWISGGDAQGTTHGSAYSYDTHVPILFYGKGIKQGASSSYHAITDIAPTLSVLLKIKFPSGCAGQPISEILD